MAGANLPHEPDYYRSVLREMEVESSTQPGLGAPGAEGGPLGEGAARFTFGERQEGDPKQGSQEKQAVALNPGGDTKSEADVSEQEPGPQQQQEQEPALVPAALPQPRRTRPRIQYTFTQSQLRELESVFQENQYPDLLTRRELSRRVYVAETKIKAWFKIRRAKYRKSQQEATLIDAPPGVQREPDVQDLEQR
ncbi:rhox homeobox family member 1-like [Erethizon dorsatum]